MMDYSERRDQRNDKQATLWDISGSVTEVWYCCNCSASMDSDNGDNGTRGVDDLCSRSVWLRVFHVDIVRRRDRGRCCSTSGDRWTVRVLCCNVPK